jgi:hypothetical protein
MWQRRTFHECAEELEVISSNFRYAHTGTYDRENSQRIMLDASRRGVEILRILALSIRNDQDFGLTDDDPASVGALRSTANESDVVATIHGYRPPYSALLGFVPLGLRQALNKIAHANPAQSGFFADNDTHDLILTGANQGNMWIAVISLIDLCRVIKALPDVQTRR